MVRVNLLPVSWQRNSCIWLKRPLELGRAITNNRSSPRTWCHVSTLTRFWVGRMAARIYFSPSRQYGCRLIVRLTKSKTYPSKIWHAEQLKPPVLRFFREGTLFWWSPSLSLSGQRTALMAWKSARLTLQRLCVGTCARVSKSSRKMSTQDSRQECSRRKWESCCR